MLRGSRIAQIINANITFIFDTNFEGDFRAIFGRFLGFRSRRVVVKGDFMDFYLSRSGWRNE